MRRAYSKNLIIARMKKDVSARQIADALNMPISKYLKKENNPSLFNLKELMVLSKITGVMLEELFPSFKNGGSEVVCTNVCMK